MDFIYQLGGITKVTGNLKVSSATPTAPRVHARRAARRRPFRSSTRSSATRSRSMSCDGHAEAHDPVAEHGPLPRRPRGDRRAVYPDMDAVLGRPSAAYADEVRAWASWDAPTCSSTTQPRLPQRPTQREEMAARGGDAEHQHEAYIRHINEALASRPEGMAITTHMCRGNFRSSWVAEGGYDFVAEALSTSSRSTASSWSGTTPARRLRAAALRAQASSWCSGS